MSLNKRAFVQEAGDQPPSTLANNFRAIEYTGTGSSNSITGLGFTPDLVAIRNISGQDDWAWFNSSNPGKFTSSNNANAEGNFTFTFDYDGFTVPPTSGMTNGNGSNYVAFCWRGTGGVLTTNTDGSTTSYTQANTTANFSIVKWTGTGSNTTIGHGLGTTPDFAIVKNLSDSANWCVKNDAALGSYRALYLNTSDGEQTNAAFWNGNAFTSTTLPLGTSNLTNGGGDNMIAYIWAKKTGFSNDNIQWAGNNSSQSFNDGSSGLYGSNFSFVPEMCIVKSKDGPGGRHWKTFWRANGGTTSWNGYDTLEMNSNSAKANSTANYITFNSSSGNYYLDIYGNSEDFNKSGVSYNAYAFG
jgi:hypothetical protein|tara:strand:+ start:554 stop:1624 length:1071 start_codon:yes stop_codon:yes gene_type:complete